MLSDNCLTLFLSFLNYLFFIKSLFLEFSKLNMNKNILFKTFFYYFIRNKKPQKKERFSTNIF